MPISRKEASKSLEWIVRFHDDFFKDLDNISAAEIRIFEKKKEKIRRNPLRQKHLGGKENCYREPITGNIRLIYLVQGKIIWMLTIGPHDKSYSEFRKKLYSLKVKYGL